jgi:hypothetical protein
MVVERNHQENVKKKTSRPSN